MVIEQHVGPHTKNLLEKRVIIVNDISQSEYLIKFTLCTNYIPK